MSNRTIGPSWVLVSSAWVGAGDHDPAPVQVNADTRWRAVVLVVTEYKLNLAPLDRVPGAGMQYGLESVEADCGKRAGGRRDTRGACSGRASTIRAGPGQRTRPSRPPGQAG